MIDLQTLAQWRTHAPWADDLMVEQDYLLGQAVERIFRDGKLSRQLAMRGGTVLHKGHLAPASRYSEDIDLVLVANRSHKGIRQDLAAALEPLLGKPLESLETTVRLAALQRHLKHGSSGLTAALGKFSVIREWLLSVRTC